MNGMIKPNDDNQLPEMISVTEIIDYDNILFQ